MPLYSPPPKPEPEKPKTFVDRARGNWAVQGLGVVIAFLVFLAVLREFFNETMPWLQEVGAEAAKAYSPAVGTAVVSAVLGAAGVLAAISVVLLRDFFRRSERDLVEREKRTAEVIAKAEAAVADAERVTAEMEAEESAFGVQRESARAEGRVWQVGQGFLPAEDHASVTEDDVQKPG
jgi:hypothetical protein